VRTRLDRWSGRGTPGPICVRRSGGHAEVLRGMRGDGAGTESGSSFVERVVGEHGNRLGPCPTTRSQRGGEGLGPPSTDRSGTGRSRRSSRRPGEPVTGRRAAAVGRRDGSCNAERCTTEWWCSINRGPDGATASGIGDAGQTSPLGGGRSGPQVRRLVQLRVTRRR